MWMRYSSPLYQASPLLLTMFLSLRVMLRSSSNTIAAFSTVPSTIHQSSTRNFGRKTFRLFSSKSKSSSKSKPESPPPPPKLLGPEDFPDWAYEPRDFFRFEILHESTKSQARVGRIHTPHGIIDTPGYVAVATNAALKGVDFRDADKVRDFKAALMLAFFLNDSKNCDSRLSLLFLVLIVRATTHLLEYVSSYASSWS